MRILTFACSTLLILPLLGSNVLANPTDQIELETESRTPENSQLANQERDTYC